MEASKQGFSSSVRRLWNLFDSNSLLVWLYVSFFIIIATFFVAAFNERPASMLKSRLDGAMGAFEFAIAAGDRIESCRQAGLIAEAYRDARSLDDYKNWVKTRDEECAKVQGRK